MACSQQKGSGEDIMAGWLLYVFRDSKEKCRQCPHCQHSLMHLRTWPPTQWLTFKPCELWDASTHSWEKPAAPLAYLWRKSNQAVSEALPTPRHVNLNRQGARTAGEDIRWGGRKAFAGVKYICTVDQPTFSELNPHPLLSQTQMCLVFLRLSLLWWDIYGTERHDSWRGPSKDLTGINHAFPTRSKKQHCQISV